jgi:hypothetical protein
MAAVVDQATAIQRLVSRCPGRERNNRDHINDDDNGRDDDEAMVREQEPRREGEDGARNAVEKTDPVLNYPREWDPHETRKNTPAADQATAPAIGIARNRLRLNSARSSLSVRSVVMAGTPESDLCRLGFYEPIIKTALMSRTTQ